MREALQHAWLRRGWLARLLWPLSLLFGSAIATRRWLYRRGVLKTHRVGVPVIVVGNLIAGGAGKTPVVMALVKHLQSRGLRPAVVSRGHGRRSSDCQEVLPHSPSSQAGDEPLLVARTCRVPVFVARQRIDSARALLGSYPETDVILCDDGLQHYALHRDIEICLFDSRGSGNGFLQPAGPLREPVSRRTDLVLCDQASPVAGGHVLTRKLADHALRADGSKILLSDLKARPLVAVAGIARPQAFFDMLRASGLLLAQTIALPDHFHFENWQAPATEGLLICTEKDAVKLWDTNPDALAVPLCLSLPQAFLTRFDRLVDAQLSSPDGLETA